MPLWAYTAISGVSAIALLYALVCLIKPFGIFRRRWHAALGALAIAVAGGVVYSIPPARPEGIEAQDWTRRVALCEQLNEGPMTCLQDSLALAPADAIASLEARLAAQNQRAAVSPPQQTTGDNATTASATPLAEATQVTAPAPPPTPPPPRNWRYVDDVDDMRDTAIRHACTESTNVVRLDFPYTTQRTRLCLRQHPRWGQDVIVRLERDGQFLCYSFQACTVRVRFDDGEVASFSAVGPSDNSTDSIFIQNDERFIRALKSAEHVIIEAEFYQAGAQQMRFDTAGLEWPRP